MLCVCVCVCVCAYIFVCVCMCVCVCVFVFVVSRDRQPASHPCVPRWRKGGTTEIYITESQLGNDMLTYNSYNRAHTHTHTRARAHPSPSCTHTHTPKHDMQFHQSVAKYTTEWLYQVKLDIPAPPLLASCRLPIQVLLVRLPQIDRLTVVSDKRIKIGFHRLYCYVL